MVECVESWEGQIKIDKGMIEGDEEKAFLVFDDSWLKLSQLMWTRGRKIARNARKQFFVEKNGEEWSKLARLHYQKQREFKIRAGEALCQYSGLEEDTTIHLRDGDSLTIVHALDAI